MTDHIADMLSRIKNGYLAKKDLVEMPYTKVLKVIANLLVENEYVQKTETKVKEGRKELIITLKYEKNKPAVVDLERISKSGLRVYVRKNNIPSVLGGIGIVIISNSQGLMTGGEARKKGLGGEIICKVW